MTQKSTPLMLRRAFFLRMSIHHEVASSSLASWRFGALLYIYTIHVFIRGAECNLTSSIFMCAYTQRQFTSHWFTSGPFILPARCRNAALQQSIAAATIFNSAAWPQTWKNPRGDSLPLALLLGWYWLQPDGIPPVRRRTRANGNTNTLQNGTNSTQRSRENGGCTPCWFVYREIARRANSRLLSRRCLYYWAAAHAKVREK